MLEGRSVENDSYKLRILDSITNARLRSVRTAVETPIREDSQDVGLHNKGSRTLIQKSWKQLNATRGEPSIKIDSKGLCNTTVVLGSD